MYNKVIAIGRSNWMTPQWSERPLIQLNTGRDRKRRIGRFWPILLCWFNFSFNSLSEFRC